METASILLFVTTAALIANSLLVLRLEKRVTQLADWAFDHGYTLVDSKRQVPLPFIGSAGKSQAVFHIVVEDDNLRRRTGLARLDGALGDQVEVEWND